MKKKKNFWKDLRSPIVGLAPMDGVTDAAFRRVVCEYSQPDFVVTEFVNVEGLARGNVKGLKCFWYDEAERPVVAQVFGVEVESFYKAAVLVCALGFDGIDINMGCPVNKVARKGSGAALIKTPDLAREIVRAVKRGVSDWAEGVSLVEAGVHEDILGALEGMRGRFGDSCGVEARGRFGSCGDGCTGAGSRGDSIRSAIPVSVKTRIGFDHDIAEEWVGILADERPDCIMMHGRTLKQLYGGEADWEAIARAASVVKRVSSVAGSRSVTETGDLVKTGAGAGSGASGIIFLGNGDVNSMSEAREKIQLYGADGVDGVLVGRAVLGNPWFFNEKFVYSELNVGAKFEALLKHLSYYEEMQLGPFNNFKKHMGWYCKGFNGARELRSKLMACGDGEEARRVLIDGVRGWREGL